MHVRKKYTPDFSIWQGFLDGPRPKSGPRFVSERGDESYLHRMLYPVLPPSTRYCGLGICDFSDSPLTFPPFFSSAIADRRDGPSAMHNIIDNTTCINTIHRDMAHGTWGTPMGNLRNRGVAWAVGVELD